MLLNSEIRNIPLLGNVDMTKFQADIHDYSGFRNDNSFFLNKRKVNWWRRELAPNEFGGLRAEISEDYFNIFKNNRQIGQISRRYYKLESRDTPWDLQDVNSVVNPYPETARNRNLLKIRNTVSNLDPFDGIIRKCGNYYFLWKKNANTNAQTVNVLNSDFTNRFNIEVKTDSEASGKIAYIDFYYAESDFDIELEAADAAKVFFHIPKGYVYISIISENSRIYNPVCYVYNPETHQQYPAYLVMEYGSGVSGEYSFNRGAYDNLTGPTVGQTIYNNMQYEVVVLGGEIYIKIKKTITVGLGVTTTYNILYKGKNIIFRNDFSGDQQYNYVSSLINKDVVSYPCKWEYNFTFATGATAYINKQISFYDDNVYQIKNYTVDTGNFYINFFNNVAQNIASNCKKLILLEGNENSNHQLTEIDHYDSNSVYFHREGKYYRLSIAITDNIKDILTSFNGNYCIFNTISYNNALFIKDETWFCSCEDWNDRIQWVCTPCVDTMDLDSTSRLNDKWQTENKIGSVSDQLPTIKRKISVKVSEITPFSSNDVWDGEEDVYDITKKKVNTSQWLIGDSLEGYYRAVEFITAPEGLTPYFITRQIMNINQQYTVYFPKTVEIDTVQPVIKQGKIKVHTPQGYVEFLVDLDEGDIYTSPSSDSERQEVPCLLDFRYIIFDSSVIAVSPTGGYTLMQNSLLGIYVFVYLLSSETNSISENDSIFIINGTEYIYKAMTERILDSSGLFVANTHLLKYLGFSSKAAYFYSIFDKCIYAFKGDNSFEKVLSLESREIVFSGFGNINNANTIYISSINLFIIKLSDSVLLVYDNQFVILETGEVTSWDFDFSNGIFYINDFAYSLIKKNIEDNNTLEKEISFMPVSFETHFYGLPENERNMINDTVYLTVDNLADLPGGSVKIKVQTIQNQKIISLAEKVINLQAKDFNDLSQAMIKYQPQVQECKGFKLLIDSDFEISELKIGMSAGAMNQTNKRI